MANLLETMGLDPHSNSTTELHKVAKDMDSGEIMDLMREVERLSSENAMLRVEVESLQVKKQSFLEERAEIVKLIAAEINSPLPENEADGLNGASFYLFLFYFRACSSLRVHDAHAARVAHAHPQAHPARVREQRGSREAHEE